MNSKQALFAALSVLGTLTAAGSAQAYMGDGCGRNAQLHISRHTGQAFCRPIMVAPVAAAPVYVEPVVAAPVFVEPVISFVPNFLFGGRNVSVYPQGNRVGHFPRVSQGGPSWNGNPGRINQGPVTTGRVNQPHVNHGPVAQGPISHGPMTGTNTHTGHTGMTGRSR